MSVLVLIKTDYQRRHPAILQNNVFMDHAAQNLTIA